MAGLVARVGTGAAVQPAHRAWLGRTAGWAAPVRPVVRVAPAVPVAKAAPEDGQDSLAATRVLKVLLATAVPVDTGV